MGAIVRKGLWEGASLKGISESLEKRGGVMGRAYQVEGTSSVQKAEMSLA